jgi:hypothetical protein
MIMNGRQLLGRFSLINLLSLLGRFVLRSLSHYIINHSTTLGEKRHGRAGRKERYLHSGEKGKRVTDRLRHKDNAS